MGDSVCVCVCVCVCVSVTWQACTLPPPPPPQTCHRKHTRMHSVAGALRGWGLAAWEASVPTLRHRHRHSAGSGGSVVVGAARVVVVVVVESKRGALPSTPAI